MFDKFSNKTLHTRRERVIDRLIEMDRRRERDRQEREREMKEEEEIKERDIKNDRKGEKREKGNIF